MSVRPVQHNPTARPGALAKHLRRAMTLLIIAGLGLIAVLLYADRHMDDEIRRELVARIQAQYPAMRVSIDSARRIEGQGIEIHRFAIDDPRPGGKRLVEIDELLAHCHTDLRRLVAGDIELRHLTIRRMTLYATRHSDGAWNAAQLLPLPQLGQNSPTATVENSTVIITDNSSGSPAELALRNINLTVAPHDAAAAKAAGEEPPLRVQGTMAGDHFKHIEIDAQLDPRRGSWSARGVADRLELSPEFRRALPVDAAAQLAPLAALQCRAGLNYWISNEGDAAQPLRFVVSGALTDGRIDDPHLPYPLTDVFAEVYCDNNGLTVSDFSAHAGGAMLTGSLQLQGYDVASPWNIRVEAKNVKLDSRLAASLPEMMHPVWRKLSPDGVVDALLQLRFDGSRHQPELRVDCVNTSFAYDEFPYRLTDGVGRVVWKDDVVSFDNFTARASGEQVTISGRLRNPGPASTGWVEISLMRPVAIDRTMLAALAQNEQLSKTVHSFHPRGLVTFWGRFERVDPQQEEFAKNLRVGLHDCAIQHDKFPYPIHKISGLVTVNDTKWEFIDLAGQNGSASIGCHGDWTPNQYGEGGALSLNFDVRDAALEDELRAALSPEGKKLWTQLRPRGTIDRLHIELTHQSATDELSLDIVAEKLKGVQDVAGRSITIHPDWFAYRLEQVTGRVRFKNGVATLENIEAVHGAARIQCSGESRSDDGGWSLVLSPLSAERLAVDHDFIAALPPQLRGAVSGLRIDVPLTVSGWLSLGGDKLQSAPPLAQWDLQLEMQNGSLFCGIGLEHVSGGVRLAGVKDHRGLRCGGEIDVDSVFYKDVQFTSVSGPIWIDDARLAVGAWTPSSATQNAAPRRLTAQSLGGTVEADAQISLQGRRQYDFNAELSGGDLALIARDTLPPGQKISGSVQAGLRLHGASEGRHTLVGDGWVRLRDADLYQLPLMVQLLKIVYAREPDPTAFTTGDIRFRVQGEHLYLDPISLQGDAISLKGKGEMDFERNLNLRFYTLLGRDSSRPAFLRPLFDEAGRQMMRIDVTGRLNQPQVQPQPLPGLDETMQQLFPEAVARENSAGSPIPSPQGLLRQVDIWPWRQ